MQQKTSKARKSFEGTVGHAPHPCPHSHTVAAGNGGTRTGHETRAPDPHRTDREHPAGRGRGRSGPP